MIINPDCIFFAGPNGLIFWNLKDHEQFELTGVYLSRATELAKNPDLFDSDHPIDKVLHSNKLIIAPDRNRQSWGWDPLSRIFHLGTKDVPIHHIPENSTEWSTRYLEHCKEALKSPFPPGRHIPPLCEKILLPQPELNPEIHNLFCSRSTTRQFEDTPVSLKKLNKILFYTLGYTPDRALPEDPELPKELCSRRCSPSGGGLNSTEGYLYIRNVEGLDQGFYYYNPNSHSLNLLRKGPVPELGSLLSGQHFSNNLPFGIFLTSRFDKLWWKYKHSRTYRMALIEIGHIAQTFQLASASSGLDTWLTGDFQDSEIEGLLEIANQSEQLLFFVGAGYGDKKREPEGLENIQ